MTTHTKGDTAVSSSQLDRIEGEITSIKSILTGNGSPERGLIVRLDRIEQTDQGRKWWLRTVGGAAAVSLVATIIEFLKKGV